jgi:hypothetical protein
MQAANPHMRTSCFVPGACGIALIVVVAIFACRYPASIWSMTDYELDSLSGALNFAYRLGDLRFYPAPSMEKHPAVPHYLLSWVGLALAGFPIASSGLEFFRSVLDHVERFHFVMIALSALAGAIGVTLFMREASKIAPIGVTAVAVALWLVSTPYSLMSLLSLTVDCFGLMLTAAFVTILWRMASERELEPSTMIFAGAVGAAAYLTKLSYINIPMGLGAAIGLVLLAGRGVRGRTILMALLFVYTVVIIVFVVGLWFIEWSSFKALLTFHASVILKGGLYGTGASGITSGPSLLTAIESIPADRTYAVAIALVAGLILIGASVATAFLKKEKLPAAVFAMGVGVASAFSGFSVLKHYAPHYSAAVSCIVPACVIAAFVMLDAWNIRLRAKFSTAALVSAALCILAIPAVSAANDLMSAYWRRTLDAEADYKVIARYIGKTPLVGFAYAAPFREYGEGFLLANIEIPQLTFQYLAEPSGTISSFTQHLVQRNVGVFIIDKSRFSTAEAVKNADNFNLLGPTEKYQATDELIELRTVFVLVRRSGTAATDGHG